MTKKEISSKLQELRLARMHIDMMGRSGAFSQQYVNIANRIEAELIALGTDSPDDEWQPQAPEWWKAKPQEKPPESWWREFWRAFSNGKKVHP